MTNAQRNHHLTNRDKNIQRDNAYSAKWRSFAPAEGWKPQTYYVVKVAYSNINVPHKAILYTGFLNGPDGSPGGYSNLMNPSYDDCHEPLASVHSLVVVREIEGMADDV